MLIDGRTLPDGETLDTGICIIGGGAAGIVMALALEGWRGKVCLLESGGFEPEIETQSLCQGEISGHSYSPYTLETSRLRYFGGSTNHWEGWCRPLDEVDFQRRDHIPHSGWPISRFQLLPYYERAQTLCELGPTHYSGKAWLAGDPGELPISPFAFETTIFQFSPPTRFGRVYRERVIACDNLKTILHANAVELRASPDSNRVQELRVATLGGGTFSVRAEAYVLAAGGIENARLLLASRGRGERGLGNEHDRVGCYFQDHLQLETAGFLASTAPGFDGSFYREHARDGTRIQAVLGGTPGLLRREKLPSFCVGLAPTSERFAGDLGPPVGELAAAVDGGETEDSPPPRNFRLLCRVEQRPNPASRVVLTDDVDALGMPRVRLDWRLEEQDFVDMRRGLQAFAQEVGEAGIGRVKLRVYDEGLDWTREITPRSHQMGTTRMADDPRQGVVDKDCRVHGIANLFVAGSSVFPTSGYADPTLTLVALALRLAENLGEEVVRERRRLRREKRG